ncbi:MAG: TraR/DksA C4-type zinc finger protein, partial [Verrucomicrobia bacterium]|nr:TraR/DksA C4-type zinc finger protein [Verrucomicrobiota bacterium]
YCNTPAWANIKYAVWAIRDIRLTGRYNVGFAKRNHRHRYSLERKLNTNTQRKYEALLKASQSALQAEIELTLADSEPVLVNGAMGRVSRGDAMQVQQMALEMKRQREERLQHIETALMRIQSGTYGNCGRCRNPIREARLDAFPEVILCVRCASSPRR